MKLWKKKKIIILREQTKNDARISYKWRNDNKVWNKTIGGGKFIKDKHINIKDEIIWFNKVKKNKSRKNLSILVDANKLIGYIYFTNIEKRKAQFHIVIGNKLFWNKGYGYRATILSLYFAKINYNLKNFYLYVRKDNIPAKKIYNKIGFKVSNVYKNDILKMEYKL